MKPAEPDDSIAAAVLEGMPDVVLVATYEKEEAVLLVRYANRSAERVLGRPREAMIGQPLRNVLADQSPFQPRADREAFLETLREAGTLEIPALTTPRDASGATRRVRARIHWIAGTDMVIALGADVTERRAARKQAGALERLRSARDVSGLLRHYLNDALTVASLNIQNACHVVSQSKAGSVDTTLFAQAADAIQSASDVLVGLSAATEVDPDLEESANLEQALRAEWDGAPQRLRLQTSDLPRLVWGSTAQLRMILAGFRPLLGEEVEARIHGGEQEVLLHLRTRAALDDWLPLLVDPTAITFAQDGGGRALRLFASVQVLHAIGGRLGMPTRDDTGLQVELGFRAAPHEVKVEPKPTPVLLVSGDGPLRAILQTQLDPRPVFFTEDIREGIAWLMSSRGGVVICDVDRTSLAPAQLLELRKMLAAAHSRRMILALRNRTPDPDVPLPQITIPTDRARLLQLVAEANS